METLRAKLTHTLVGITVAPASTITETTIITPRRCSEQALQTNGNPPLYDHHWRGNAAHQLTRKRSHVMILDLSGDSDDYRTSMPLPKDFFRH